MLGIKYTQGEERNSCWNSVGKYLAKGWTLARRSIRKEQHTEVDNRDTVYEEMCHTEAAQYNLQKWFNVSILQL